MKKKSLLLLGMLASLTTGSAVAQSDESYLEVDLSSGSLIKGEGVTANDTKTSLSFTSSSNANQWGYNLGSTMNNTNYKYLVIVPRKQYPTEEYNSVWTLKDGTTTEEEDKTKREIVREGAGYEILYQLTDANGYELTDKTTDSDGKLKNNDADEWTWGFAYGTYQRRRALVFNIANQKVYTNSDEVESDATDFTATSTDSNHPIVPVDFSKLAKLGIYSTSTSGKFDISAIFFTNYKSNYDNTPWDPVGAWGKGPDYTRQHSTEGTYGTICLPYDAAICGADAYKVVGVDNLTSPNKLYLETVYGVLKAGTPYIYKTNASNVTITHTNTSDATYTKEETTTDGYVTFYRADSKTASEPVAATGLTGTFTDADNEVPTGSYVLSNGTWIKDNGIVKNTISQYKAYLTLDKSFEVTSSQAASYQVMDINSGVVTGINAANTVKSTNTNHAIYNMNGVRVDNPTKGLYIQNGKLSIVK